MVRAGPIYIYIYIDGVRAAMGVALTHARKKKRKAEM